MKKTRKTNHKFTVEVLNDDIKFLIVNEKEAALINQALLRCTFPSKTLHQDKKLTEEFDKLLCKIQTQLGML